MSRFDIGRPQGPLRVTVELAGAGHHPGAAILADDRWPPDIEGWVDLTEGLAMPARAGGRESTVRIQAPDLVEAAQRSAHVRTAAESAGGPATVSVLVEIAVMIARDAPAARDRLARLDAYLEQPWIPDSLSYVGTPTGLAGLLTDLHSVGVADGVVLQPMLLPEVLEHIAFDTLPRLESAGVPMSGTQLGLLRRLGLRRGDPVAHDHSESLPA
ncbi:MULTISPECIES: hypothetical protein [Nocardia]|uniref:hypothetical protein n=1 Tax=Nocardia TaxID=1817 RepID=UPI0013002FC0|nr:MULTISPECIES: hypothetical protein [Nocardia]